MKSIFSMWLVHCVLFFVLGLSFAVQGIPIGPTKPGQPGPGVPERTTTTDSGNSASISLATSSSSTDTYTSSAQASTSSSGISPYSTGTSTSSIIISTKLALSTSTTLQSRTEATTTTGIQSSTTSSSPSTTTSSSSSSTDKRTLTIALSVTFSILGTIFLILCTILLIQCTKSTPSYQRFRLRCFPFNRGGATPLSDNEIASWREKPLSPPGITSPTPYANLIQRYSRPLSLTRPLNSNPVNASNLPQLERGFPPLKPVTSRSTLNRPAVPPKLILTGGGIGANSNRTPLRHPYSAFPTLKPREKIISDRGQRSAPLPPIARAPNSRPGLTDESLPGTPAFILPTHPRRVSRKLSKTRERENHSIFSPIIGSKTTPSTPRPSTSNSQGKRRRRRSMPGLRGQFMNEEGWTPRRCEEDPVVQRGSLGLGAGGGVHSRSRSDLTPFKEAMEGRVGVVRPSFEESLGRVREEAPS